MSGDVTDLAPQNARKFLTVDSILTVDDLGYAEVEVPEWGGWVRVRGMTAGERAAYALQFVDEDQVPADTQARLVQMCAVDEAGERLFTEEHITGLSAKSPTAMERLTGRIMELSGFGAAEKN